MLVGVVMSSGPIKDNGKKNTQNWVLFFHIMFIDLQLTEKTEEKKVRQNK